MFPHGDYYLKEISVPDGWMLSADRIPVKLTSDNKAAGEDVIVIELARPILNHLIYTPVTITKTDISGAERLHAELLAGMDAEAFNGYWKSGFVEVAGAILTAELLCRKGYMD